VGIERGKAARKREREREREKKKRGENVRTLHAT